MHPPAPSDQQPRRQTRRTSTSTLRDPDAAQRGAHTKSHVTTARRAWGTVTLHLKKHVGVGILCAVAYFDPGNWSVDLQAGSQFGYKLLFVVLISGICAVFLQILAAKLGSVTGLDLAAHCRLLLHDHPRYPRLVRRVFLYPLYVLSEVAIISTDLAELLGSAIGLVLLFPKLPLSVAVMLTALDVIFILALGDSKQRGRPLRMLELIIIILVVVVFICFIILIVKVSPKWPEVFEGYLPSKTLVQPSGLYAAIGILGATVMPHALYLGSHMATQDRISMTPTPPELPAPSTGTSNGRRSFRTVLRGLFSIRKTQHGDEVDVTTPYGERENNTLAFVKAHLTHGIADIVLSLLGFAVAINSAILVLAGAVFFFGPGRNSMTQAAGLFDAHDLIRNFIGKPAALIFALALVCSGQSASITATLAGQIVSEGFIQWSVSPFLRRLITRLLSLIPSMVVAVVVGRPGIDTLLVVSQVVLSIVLPFVMFPLVWLTSSTIVMRVKRPRDLVTDDITITTKTSTDESEKEEEIEEKKPGSSKLGATMDDDEAAVVISASASIEDCCDDIILSSSKAKGKEKACDVVQLETVLPVDDDTTQFVDYSNGWALSILSYAIWIVVVVANGYLIVTLAID
ncbi:natural resistance-associated macrophage protein [Schizopora paradoxa]|uniref:Natural resistance-associated macrophage protein n=1 Tax=Schizopora paradoxa TaxID=27342 RepID=A0A0H2S8D8_9AGAM|nr:natural resistance-associated macrophage protein [Schizopora paradoxa]